MGEFINFGDGRQIKIGVMDDLRYVRREECERFRYMDTRNDAAAALANPASLWRFPWPDEDAHTMGAIGGRDMFRTYTFALDHPPLEGIDHGDGSRFGRGVCLHIQAKGGGYGFNVILPCPTLWGALLPSLLRVRSPLPPTPIQIYGVRYDQRGERTILRCGWCEQPFSLSDDDAERVRQKIRGDGARFEDRREWYENTADRIRAGRPWPVAV